MNDGAGPSEPTPSVFMMGAGVVGTALATWLARAGVRVLGLHGRSIGPADAARPPEGVVASAGELPDAVSESDVIIIAARDERIPAVGKRLVDEARLRPGQVVLHTSGAHAAATILAAVRPHVRAVGTFHPLVSFADARFATEGLAGAPVAFGIEGDAPASDCAARLVRALRGHAVFLEAQNLPLYHAAAVLASNYVVALADVARRLFVDAGVPADEALPALLPLLSSVVENLAQVGLPGALSGPVERGDVATVERHLGALRARAPELVELYRFAGRGVLRLAREKSRLEADVVERFEALFGPTRPLDE